MSIIILLKSMLAFTEIIYKVSNFCELIFIFLFVLRFIVAINRLFFI